MLCVSHDRTFLSNFTNKVFWLDRGDLKISPKGFKNFDNWSEELLNQEARELRNRKQFVNLEVEWAQRGVKARVKRNVKRLERILGVANSRLRTCLACRRRRRRARNAAQPRNWERVGSPIYSCPPVRQNGHAGAPRRNAPTDCTRFRSRSKCSRNRSQCAPRS